MGLPPCIPDVHWWWAWPAVGAGVHCADMTFYRLGRWCGPRLFEYCWVQRIIKPERRRRFEHLFHSHGIKFLLTAWLLPPLRTGVFVIAGALSFPLIQFIIADAVYADWKGSRGTGGLALESCRRAGGVRCPQCVRRSLARPRLRTRFRAPFSLCTLPLRCSVSQSLVAIVSTAWDFLAKPHSSFGSASV